MSSDDMGRRERKKQQTRQSLSDAAAELFLARGFDGVRMADVAASCEVSEKTVYNYFATKEALVMDRLESTAKDLRTALVDAGEDPVQACVALLGAELDATLHALKADAASIERYRLFGHLVGQTRSLRAYQSDMHDRFVTIAEEGLSQHAHRSRDDPRIVIAARALIGLWRVQQRSLSHHLDEDFNEIRRRVEADVQAALDVVLAAISALAEPARTLRPLLPHLP